jgi:hypothetical protein
VSFRALEKQQQIREVLLNQRGNTPAHTTICNWILKVGYHELTRSVPQGEKWVILLDTSIQLGQEKVLVILGIRERAVDFNRPLKESDLTPLAIVIANKWTGKTVADELLKLKIKVGTILYGVGDHGGEIKKGLELAGIVHVHDITHVVALLMEKRYRNDPRYKDFCTRMSTMRSKLSQSQFAEIIPPSQRKKSAYQNIRPITEWATKCLKILEGLDTSLPRNQRVQQELSWLSSHKGLIDELDQLTTAINKIEKELKHKGLSESSLRYCNAVLNQLQIADIQDFKIKLLAKFQDALNKLPNHHKIICTSDILESIFGHYKNFLSNCPMAGVTHLVLVIAAFTANITPDYIKNCMEKVSMAQVYEWKRKNIRESLFQRRIEFFRDTG